MSSSKVGRIGHILTFQKIVWGKQYLSFIRRTADDDNALTLGTQDLLLRKPFKDRFGPENAPSPASLEGE
ncbi:uncharacterized protein EAF02_010054 [Botrytis sinoallii]|uniref:uncharacterized protein n=1 Tax=Botrytis sinoallii TaxID=1463999 RepID=UPI001902AD18|nr:uncharacterized protein EAF02_010054 [Botrytis sinoallii]KAF7865631.1 hypothetical protein EAF02_010054 [Botrytis sinoallii]